MEAELLQRDLFDFDDWTFVEMVIWRVPSPVHGSRHHDTYRVFHGRPGKRLVGDDHKRQKGDHRHVQDREDPYSCKDVDTLVRDVFAAIERRKSK